MRILKLIVSCAALATLTSCIDDYESMGSDETGGAGPVGGRVQGAAGEAPDASGGGPLGGAAQANGGAGSGGTGGAQIAGAPNLGGKPTAGSGGAVDAGGAPACPDWVFPGGATNYSFEVHYDATSVAVKDATDLLFDWSELSVDLLGRPIAPEDIELVLVGGHTQPPEQFLDTFGTDSFSLANADFWLTHYPSPGSTSSVSLLELSSFGSAVPEQDLWRAFDTSNPEYRYGSGDHTYYVTVQGSTTPLEDVRMLRLFTLDPDAEETTVRLTNDSATLDWSATFPAETIPVAARTSDLTVYFDGLLYTASGVGVDRVEMSDLVVAHFDTETRSELEAQVWDLRDSADGWWSGSDLDILPFPREAVSLAEFRNEAGKPFPGIDDSGTWLLLAYDRSDQPPWLLSVLTPCD